MQKGVDKYREGTDEEVVWDDGLRSWTKHPISASFCTGREMNLLTVSAPC